MNILSECQDGAFKILRHVKHVGSSITKPPPIWKHISADSPESSDHFGTNIVIYNALCTVCAQIMLLTEFGFRFFGGFGFRRTFDLCGMPWPRCLASGALPVPLPTKEI